MGNKEYQPFFLFTEQFDNREKRPKTIQQQTAFWIDMYAQGGTLFSQEMKDYLQEYTIPFIHDIRDGLGHFERLARISNKRYLDSLIAKREPKLPTASTQEEQQAMEAFDTALTTFWYLPENTKVQFGPYEYGFSTRGNLRPPQTVDEFLWRTYELYQFTAGLADGSIDPGLEVGKSMAKLRSIAFFKQGGEMPLSRSGMETDKPGKTRVTYRYGFDEVKKLGDLDEGKVEGKPTDCTKFNNEPKPYL